MLAHEGPSRPSPQSPGPPALAALLKERGPGRLARQLDLDPGDALRAEFAALDVLGWWPLRAAGAEPLGRFTSGRAYLMHAPSRSPGLFIAHVWGMVVPVGRDLDDLTSALVRGVAIDLELSACATALRLRQDSLPGLKDASVDGLGDAFSVEAVYDTDALGADERFARALADGSDAERDEALAAFLASGISLEVLPRAAAAAIAAGEAGTDVADTVQSIRARRPFLDEQTQRLARAAPLLNPSRAALEALGLGGGTSPADPGATAAALFTRTEVVIAGALEAARAEGIFDAPHFQDALAACSPEDAHACAALVSGSPPFAHTDPSRCAYPTDEQKFLLALATDAPPRWDTFTERQWPLLFALSLCPPHYQLWTILACVRDPQMAPALETYLLRPDSLRFGYEPRATVMLGGTQAAAAAALRAQIGPIGEEVVEAARATLATDGEPPEKYGRYEAVGVFELLGHARLDSALALLGVHATRNPYLAVEAARRAGDRPAARALLQRIWSDPKRYTVQPALGAAKLAASFGDAGAKAAMSGLAKSEHRNMRRYRNM